MDTRLLEKQKVQDHLVNVLNLCAVPIWKGNKKPAFQSKGKREDSRPWTEIVEADKGRLYDMEQFDLGIKGTQLSNDGEQRTYFLWVDVDFHHDSDRNVFDSELLPVIQNKGFLITQSPSGGYHIGLRTTEDPKSTTRVFEYPNSGITVDFRASHTQCVVIDSAGRYNIVELPDTLIYMDFTDFNKLFTERLGFKLPTPCKTKENSVLREYVQQYLNGEQKPVEVDTNLWMFGVIRYLMGIHNNHEDSIIKDAVKALEQCTPTDKDEDWIVSKVRDCLNTQEPLSLNPGRPKSGAGEALAKQILSEIPIYSDKALKKMYITTNGFLEEITRTIGPIITKEHGTDINETKQVEHFLIAHAEDVPPTVSTSIRFNNGVFDTLTNTFDPNNEDICLVGFPNYSYNPNAHPKKFMHLIHTQIEQYSLSNLYTWLKKLPTASKEIRMAILYGKPGTGKTALAETLKLAMSNFGHSVTMSDFFNDRATMAQVIGKTYLYFQDTPKKWQDIDRLKQITGETSLTLRNMYDESKMTRNMLNIAMSTNTLAKIDSDDEAPMFDRLTLIQFKDNKVRGTDDDDEDFAANTAEEEGEDIISYCLNLRKLDTKFDSSEVTRQQWMELSSPELRLIKTKFVYKAGYDGLSIHEVMNIIPPGYEIKNIRKAIKDSGYSQKGEKFIGLKLIELDNGQQKLGN